ncbi:Hypothetical protein A7982_05246 [Minicystis rosea]|nr:Hypothetical protein A7982_05246 [Minicystis rosea]
MDDTPLVADTDPLPANDILVPCAESSAPRLQTTESPR